LHILQQFCDLCCTWKLFPLSLRPYQRRDCHQGPRRASLVPCSYPLHLSNRPAVAKQEQDWSRPWVTDARETALWGESIPTGVSTPISLTRGPSAPAAKVPFPSTPLPTSQVIFYIILARDRCWCRPRCCCCQRHQFNS
jgi:hypothetical protein